MNSINKKIIALLVIFFISASAEAQYTSLKKEMVIRKSVKIKKTVYNFKGYDSLNRSVIIIEGNNIVVDFNNAVLNGNGSNKMPDQFYGVAIIIKNAKNITIKNLTAKGYKIALLARNVEDLKIENCNFSYNYRQHLNSTQEKEDISDWMSYHHNEKDEWLRYGAAMYLRQCNNAIISNCKVTGGQNALMMTECNNALIYNNDFSFNSGIGLGMYRCSYNKVLYNKINFNVRGYSDGVYNRGQDSAGILVYEQSNNNTFYNNSATHSGDGFFLWAGQTTMDTGKGGCNDNLIMNNDFSYAPTNGVEVTFSRNKIIHNCMFECDNGIWSGYSFNTTINGNQFRQNTTGIAIEHGQDNNITDNLFWKDKDAIRLWANKEQASDWGYPKYRDTRSKNYVLVSNSFNRNPVVFNIKNTDSIKIFANRVSFDSIEYKIDSSVTNIDTTPDANLLYRISEKEKVNLPNIKIPVDPFKGNGKLAGRKNILITEWGPYNFQYPIIWNTNPTDTSSMKFDVLGPKGKWKIVSVKGLENVSTMNGSTPASITAKKIKSGRTDVELVAEFTGASFTDQFGNKIPANKPYRFSFKKFFQPIDFTVKWFAFDSTNNPITINSIEALQKQQPFKTEKTNRLDYAWWGGINANHKQYTRFLTIAQGSADMEGGTYELSVTWDDAVRVYIDNKLVIDEWNPSEYIFDESPNKKVLLTINKGFHKFRIEHVELGGFATLNLKLKKW